MTQQKAGLQAPSSPLPAAAQRHWALHLPTYLAAVLLMFWAPVAAVLAGRVRLLHRRRNDLYSTCASRPSTSSVLLLPLPLPLAAPSSSSPLLLQSQAADGCNGGARGEGGPRGTAPRPLHVPGTLEPCKLQGSILASVLLCLLHSTSAAACWPPVAEPPLLGGLLGGRVCDGGQGNPAQQASGLSCLAAASCWRLSKLQYYCKRGMPASWLLILDRSRCGC